MKTLRRFAVSISSFTLLVVVFACGGSSPTQPALPQVGGGAALAGQAVITGVVTGGGGNFSSEGLAPAAINPVNVQVSVEGTGIGTRTDSKGRFRLVNVPSGNVRVRFTSSETNAMLTVGSVGSTQHIDLMVQLQPTSATIAAEVREALEQFQSLVTSVVLVDPENGTVLLADGTTVVVDNVTWWDTGGDYHNLTDLQAAVLAGTQVEAMGQGTLDVNGPTILASVIRVKAFDAEFEGVVQAASGVDPSGTIVLVTNLKGGVAEVRVDSGTSWDPTGDLVNLTELLEAFGKGLLIEVEGKGSLDAGGTFILAGEIKAELTEDDFEGVVASAAGADPSGTVVLVLNSKGPITTILVDADTVWEGDASALSQLIALLGGPYPVKVEGEGWRAADGTFILATRIKVEVEDGEDDVCDGSYAAQVLAIKDLIELAETIAAANGFNGGQTNSFVSKLENAAKSLEKCNATPAVNQLGAFINEVNAYVGSGKLTATDGETLVTAAQSIIAQINGGA